MNIVLKHIGKSAEDLRFFILKDGAHAGGVTVHSEQGTCFSYGIAVSETRRRQGIAKAALPLLFDFMKGRGCETVLVQVWPDIAAALALHTSLGFDDTARDSHAVTLTKTL